MSLPYDEKLILISILGDDQVHWLEAHYKFFKKNLSRLENDVYAHMPEAVWSMGYADCLWVYVIVLQNSSTARLRGAANGNSWFLDPYRPLPVRHTDIPRLSRLPTMKFHPLKKISRFRQWQSEREFCALLPDLYHLLD